MPNEELIRTVIKRIERDIEMWDQDTWGRVDSGNQFWNSNLPGDVVVKVPAEAQDEGMFAEEITVTPISDIDLSQQPQFMACGTTFCFAGHTVLESGDTMLVSVDSGLASLCRTPDGQVRHIYHRAMELLGLTEEQAGEMFSADIEDLDELKRAIAYHTEVDLL